jgi:hypothetical protein
MQASASLLSIKPLGRSPMTRTVMTQPQIASVYMLLDKALKRAGDGLVEYESDYNDQVVADAAGVKVESVINMRQKHFGNLKYKSISVASRDELVARITELEKEVSYLFTFLKLKPNGGYKP